MENERSKTLAYFCLEILFLDPIEKLIKIQCLSRDQQLSINSSLSDQEDQHHITDHLNFSDLLFSLQHPGQGKSFILHRFFFEKSEEEQDSFLRQIIVHYLDHPSRNPRSHQIFKSIIAMIRKSIVDQIPVSKFDQTSRLLGVIEVIVEMVCEYATKPRSQWLQSGLEKIAGVIEELFQDFSGLMAISLLSSSASAHCSEKVTKIAETIKNIDFLCLESNKRVPFLPLFLQKLRTKLLEISLSFNTSFLSPLSTGDSSIPLWDSLVDQFEAFLDNSFVFLPLEHKSTHASLCSLLESDPQLLETAVCL